LDIGKYVHDAIEKYYKNNFLINGNANDILIKTYANLKKIWDITLPPEALAKAYQCLTHHAEWEYSNRTNGMSHRPIAELEHDGAGYYGFIDYIDLDNEKVIDWKTNTWPVLSYEYRMQAHVYRELYEDKFGKKLSHLYFFFLHPNEWRTVAFDKEKQIEVGKDVENLREKILNKEYPKEPRTKSECKNCLYKFYCKVLKI